MAEIREIALGIATVITSSNEPEPFPVILKGQSLPDAALLIRAVINECADAGLTLQKVEVGIELLHHLRDGHLPERSCRGVQIVGVDELSTQLLFYRQSPRRSLA